MAILLQPKIIQSPNSRLAISHKAKISSMSKFQPRRYNCGVILTLHCGSQLACREGMRARGERIQNPCLNYLDILDGHNFAHLSGCGFRFDGYVKMWIGWTTTTHTVTKIANARIKNHM